MLGAGKVTAFIATVQPDRAKEFYRRTLGLRLVSDDDFAVVFDCAGVQLRIQKVQEHRPHPFTALGWQVPGVRKTATVLAKKGVVFERYGFMEQDEIGVWQAPSGAKVAWFKDPDGNLLSLTEMDVPAKRRRRAARTPKATQATARKASSRPKRKR